MNGEERVVAWGVTGVLLLAALIRFGWEVRPVPPLFPPDTTAYPRLVEATREAVAAEERRRTPLEPGERVDPNRAPAIELARLPGVGPAIAGRIVEARDEGGPFRSPEDLLRVSGVGPATLARIRGLLNLDDPPAMGAAALAGGVLPSTGEPGPATGPNEGLVDVNRAGLEELQRLPGVGPALARRILENRQRHGPFPTVDAMTRVGGIGPASVERLRGHAVVRP